MTAKGLDNASPTVYSVKPRIERYTEADYDENVEDPIDAGEIFDLIRDINDPEHPLTLEQLNVVQEELITVCDEENEKIVDVRYTPTIPHCSMATLIGLAIRIKLLRSLHPSVKVIVRITPGTHNTEDAINKQLADKERVAAAMENSGLMRAVDQCLTPKDF
ncbi:MIP18 family protein F45G2.10 [Toxocara canis]|uniref:MIP18 family protein F45G2.10 n=1 Tax=Toxocara canis TaxID=6265 RepID=A0A0B2VZZ6_TOXCA|nr:MIP18 family protein F45G2.10 [Toxocara canis]